MHLVIARGLGETDDYLTLGILTPIRTHNVTTRDTHFSVISTLCDSPAPQAQQRPTGLRTSLHHGFNSHHAR